MCSVPNSNTPICTKTPLCNSRIGKKKKKGVCILMLGNRESCLYWRNLVSRVLVSWGTAVLL